jgi:hypothetical protein
MMDKYFVLIGAPVALLVALISSKLEQVSGKFRELKQRAMAEVQRRMARLPGPAEGEQSTDAV